MDTGHQNNTTHWGRVKDLFARAENLTQEERTGWLKAQCIGADGSLDSHLLNEVLALLESHDSADKSDYLSESAISRKDLPATTYLTDGSMIGPWKLDVVIGQGGMGNVYRAHRADGAYDRAVALKVIRVSGKAEKAKFQSEVKILARLEHPNIARLYDAAIADGIPYLAIALVEGESITSFAKTRQLTSTESIQLFLQVTDAVAYAHRNLVVHRDIKPSNIIVDQAGQAFLLDFGIARMIAEDGTELTQTIPVNNAMTLAYAAPEQIRMEPITTATDVYALGLVLYELLTGHRPYSVAGKSPTDIERIICDSRPAFPTAVAADNVKLDADIDTIVMKSIAKSPEERYISVSNFASDLRRYLGGMPIEARPPTGVYRIRKFVQRNRGSVAATFLVLLALLSGISVALWQGQVAARERDLAQRRFDSAREMAGGALFDIHDAVAEVPGSTAVRELIVARSLAYLEELAADAGDDNLLRLDIASAYLRTGNVLGNPNNANLGRLHPALESYKKGLAILPQRRLNDSLDSRVDRSRAVINEKRAEVYSVLGETDSVTLALGRANSILAGLAADQPDKASAQIDLVISHIKTGDLLGNPNFPNAGRLDEAIQHYHKALIVLDRADEIMPDSAKHLRERGLIHERLGAVLFVSDKQDDAIANYERSFEIRQQLFEKDPTHLDTYRDIGVAHEKLALVFQGRGELDRSYDEFQKALEVFESLAASDLENVQAQRSLAIEYLHVAELMFSTQMQNMGRKLESINYANRAMKLLAPDGRPDPDDKRLAGLIEWAERVRKR